MSIQVSLADKLQSLTDWLQQQRNVVVAYSGGVDSALLLYLGTRILGPGHCYGLHGDSCFMSRVAHFSALDFADLHKLIVKTVPLHPLALEKIVKNSQLRCYFCKKNTYSIFLKNIGSKGVLLDGTNLDDLNSDRPGFRVLAELGVATPYLDCHISKDDIRSLCFHLGLSVWSKLSESCLATRVQSNTSITLPRLKQIEQVEIELSRLGFVGCRVQIQQNKLFLTLRTDQNHQIVNKDMVKHLENIAKRYDFTKVFLDLFEREGILPSLLDYIGFRGHIPPKKQLIDHFNNMSGNQ